MVKISYMLIFKTNYERDEDSSEEQNQGKENPSTTKEDMHQPT